MDNGDFKICRKCRRVNLRSAKYCSACEYPFLAHFDRPRSQARVHSYVPLGKLPAVAPAAQDVTMAAQLSVILPGAGQIYNEQLGKGAVILLAFLALLGLTVVIKWFAIVSLLLVWLMAIVDAAVIAGKIAEGQKVRKWHWF